MKAVHQSPSPVREVSSSVSYSASTSVQSKLKKINEIVVNSSPFVPILLNDEMLGTGTTFYNC